MIYITLYFSHNNSCLHGSILLIDKFVLCYTESQEGEKQGRELSSPVVLHDSVLAGQLVCRPNRVVAKPFISNIFDDVLPTLLFQFCLNLIKTRNSIWPLAQWHRESQHIGFHAALTLLCVNSPTLKGQNARFESSHFSEQ